MDNVRNTKFIILSCVRQYGIVYHFQIEEMFNVKRGSHTSAALCVKSYTKLSSKIA